MKTICLTITIDNPNSGAITEVEFDSMILETIAMHIVKERKQKILLQFKNGLNGNECCAFYGKLNEK